jgi:hypothetical protein
MEEEQGLYEFLGEIGPIVPAAKMREFVQHNDFQLIRRKIAQRPFRQNHGRTKESKCGGNSDLVGT